MKKMIQGKVMFEALSTCFSPDGSSNVHGNIATQLHNLDVLCRCRRASLVWTSDDLILLPRIKLCIELCECMYVNSLNRAVQRYSTRQLAYN